MSTSTSPIRAHLEFDLRSTIAAGSEKSILDGAGAPRAEVSAAALLRPDDQSQKNSTATIIQSIWRGHVARINVAKTRRQVLSNALLERAKPYIDVAGSLRDVPKASVGNTTVYLPIGLPIVLKASGSPANQKRFEQMQQAREICEKNGFTSLVIPKARVYGTFIVESRLPISRHDTKEQIGLYVENRDLFTAAVKEFTEFLCRSKLSDLLGSSPYGRLAGVASGRYDNVPLYLEAGQGKIGLIDLESFSPDLPPRDVRHVFYACANAASLFPYHFEEILSVAKKFDLKMEESLPQLAESRDGSLKLFKLTYEDHAAFIRKNRIGLEDPLSFKKLEGGRIEELKKVVEDFLRKEHKSGFSFRGFLGEKPDETLASFNAKVFPLILDGMHTLIQDLLKFNLGHKIGEGGVSSYPKLLSLRTLYFGCDPKILTKFEKLIAQSLDMLRFGQEDDCTYFVSYPLLDLIFTEFVKGGEIASYIPRFGPSDSKCLFL
jgi:hypothetical protein